MEGQDMCWIGRLEKDKFLLWLACDVVRGTIFIDQETSGFWDWKCLAKKSDWIGGRVGD